MQQFWKHYFSLEVCYVIDGKGLIPYRSILVYMLLYLGVTQGLNLLRSHHCKALLTLVALLEAHAYLLFPVDG